MVKLVEVIPIDALDEDRKRDYVRIGSHLCLRQEFVDDASYRRNMCKIWAVEKKPDVAGEIAEVKLRKGHKTTYEVVDVDGTVLFWADLYQPTVEDLEAEIMEISTASNIVVDSATRVIADALDTQKELDRIRARPQLDRRAVEMLRGAANFATPVVISNPGFVAAMHRVDEWLERTQEEETRR